ncbi:MAG: bifunctional (p)ppGpp synthetase/guanosine-3',5'-bis(diphosphate) 3'-pyrophosphohydrolase [Gammaproteobacteria bacterium]|nr:bifunctional (p)ppGpp synthetase/guanosine-3',5'-bis(diphosphate) 3'-pyrophosphohydrolase [Gammaproteobacteria bacterium]
MVKRQSNPESHKWLDEVTLKKASDIAGTHLEEGLGIARIISELGLEDEALVACIMYPAYAAKEVHLDTITERFGDAVGVLLRDIVQMGELGKLQQLDNAKSHQVENLRKMLLAMVSDVRAVLIILAERLWLLRKGVNEKFARETLNIYAPLANRLGVASLKWEMEDLCFRYWQPEQYKKIAKFLSSRREERESYINNVIHVLKEKLTHAGIKSFEVSGRVKHIYSIYKKMERKNSPLEEIYDISAVRVLVPTVEDCYAVLGLVHDAWERIPKEFDDYITHPKPNGYRSIHTAVIGPEERTVEVQIRTHSMHQESELGVAAHWRYKEGGAQKSSYEAKIAWLRQVMEWQREIKTDKEKPTQDLFADRVYVFTPTGDIIDLPQGATPLDFAYHVHSEVGHRCKGAKVDGSIVPLTYHLQTGERVEILTQKNPNPSRDWLSPYLGYLKSPRARAKVSHWFNALEQQQESHKEKEVKLDIKETPAPVLVSTNIVNIKKKSSKKSKSDLQILGVGHLLTQIARCCKPLPGEDIIGYITQGKGVSIHRKSCRNIIHVSDDSKKRLIEVDWGDKAANIYPVDLYIEAYDRHGLLRDITNYFANEKVNVLSILSNTEKYSHEAHIHVTVEISGLETLQHILDRLKGIPNVIGAWREKRG